MSSDSYKSLPIIFNYFGQNVKYATVLRLFVKMHNFFPTKCTFLVFTAQKLCDIITIRTNCNQEETIWIQTHQKNGME